MNAILKEGNRILNLVLQKFRMAIGLSRFPIWKTIELGAYKHSGTLREAVRKICDCSVIDQLGDVDWGKAFLVDPEVKEVDLVIISAAELGPSKDKEQLYSYQDICDKSKELGLELCSPDIAFQLRLQYLDQPYKDYLYMFINPKIIHPKGDLDKFVLWHDDSGLQLSVNSHAGWQNEAAPRDVQSGDALVFVLPR